MKNFNKIIAGLMLMSISLVSMPIFAASNIESAIEETIKDDLVGGWEYSVEGAPEGYDSGLMMIIKTGKMYKVQIQTAAATILATDVVVKKNDITFKLMIEGESVSVALSADGSSLTGKTTSSSGVFNITGKKTLSP